MYKEQVGTFEVCNNLNKSIEEENGQMSLRKSSNEKLMELCSVKEDNRFKKVVLLGVGRVSLALSLFQNKG